MAQLIEKKRLVSILRGFDFAKVQRVKEYIRNYPNYYKQDSRSR